MADTHSMTAPGAELRRVRSLIADLDAIVWEADARTMLHTFVSEGSTEILGYTMGEWLAEPSFWADHLHPDDRERAVAEFVRAATHGDRFDMEYRFLAKDETSVWLRDIGHVVKDVTGEPTIVRGLMVEVTAQKALEEERHEAEQRFRRVVERLPAIVYIEGIEEGTERAHDIAGPMLYVSPQVKTILGFEPDEWTGDPRAWARQFHPEDLERIRAKYERIEERGAPFSADYRMFARDGRVVWFHDEAVVVRDDRGTPLFWQGILYDTTEQRATESRADETETRYRTLIEQLPAIVYSEPVIGNRINVMYISPRVEEVLGISQEEWMADPDVWLRSMHPDDRPRVEAENARTERTGDPFVVEYRSIARDGRAVWFHDEARLVNDEHGAPLFWQGVMMDVTAEKEAQSQLAEAEARYRTLIEQTPAITYIDALEGPLATLYISPQTTTILGYTPEEWYEDPNLWSKIVHPDDNTRDDYVDESGEPVSSEYRLIAKDGRTVWMHDQARLISDEHGDPKYWQGLLVDVTAQKEAEQLVRELDRAQETAQRLRDVDEAKNTFLQAVSHDLRTPLAAILGLAVTLSRDDFEMPPVEVRDMATRIASNAKKLDRIVNDLLDLDRLSRGIVEPKLASVDVGELVRRFVSESDVAQERRVTVQTEPIVIPVDAPKVERILENLLANTARHTPPESSVWVLVERMDAGVLIAVEDDGPGVPQELREAIFEPFSRGDEKGNGPGVGVGLTLVSKFAELHGGRAWVQEREGGGASFRVFLSGRPASDQTDATSGSSDSDASQA